MGIKIPILAYCPINGNRPMSCTREGFLVSCQKFQENLVRLVKPYSKWCGVCQGRKRPENITFIKLQDKKGEMTMTVPTTTGPCALCGKIKTLRKHQGKRTCSSCQIIRIGAKNRPEIIFKALDEFGNLPEKPVDQGATETELAKSNADLEKIIASQTVYQEELLKTIENYKKEMSKRSPDDWVTLPAAEILHVEDQTALDTVAWKLLEGIATGAITGVDVADVRVIRGL